MVEHILTLCGQVHLDLGLVVDGRELVAGHGELVHCRAQDKHLLAVLAQLYVGPSRVHLVHQLGRVLAHVQLPQVVASLEFREVVEVVAVVGDHGTGDAARVGCESHHAVLDAFKLDDDVLDLVLLLVGLVILLLVLVFLVDLGFLLVGLFLGLLLGLLDQLVVLLAHAIFVVGILVDKCQQHVVLRAPRAVGAHTVAVAGEQDGIALHDPLGCLAEVSTAGDVGDLAAVGADDAHVGVWITLVGDISQGEPLAVGRPLVVKSAVGLIPRRAVGHLVHPLALEVHDHEAIAVFDKGQLLSVGAHIGRGALDGGRRQQNLLLDGSGVGEVGVFLALDGGLDQLPVAIALGGIVEGAVVTAPRQAILGLGCVGDALGGAILDRGDKDLATGDEGHLLAVGRCHCRGSATRHGGAQHILRVVVIEVNLDLDGLAALRLGVQLAVVGVTQRAIVGD